MFVPLASFFIFNFCLGLLDNFFCNLYQSSFSWYMKVNFNTQLVFRLFYLYFLLWNWHLCFIEVLNDLVLIGYLWNVYWIEVFRSLVDKTSWKPVFFIITIVVNCWQKFHEWQKLTIDIFIMFCVFLSGNT